MVKGSAKRATIAPYVVWSAIFVIVPIILVIYYSLCVETDGKMVFSWANYARAFQPTYIDVMLRSGRLALISTAACLLLGYPVAYIMASKDFANKSFLLFLFLVPMWMNFLLRTYAWLTLLDGNGIINTFLQMLGLRKFSLLYNNGAVVLGMVYNFIPFMILPIYTVLKKMDQSLIEAAQDLGADSRNVFFRLIFPLSLPGVISGITMVFMPAVTTFIISDLLGGSKSMLIGNLIEQQFLKVSDWNFGSAVSVILMGVVLVLFTVFTMVDKDGEGGALY
ncbi:MAG: ABC transporter permease [Defluviitaleaceae bacterium]|nr:ABC transporter permease [Defluviitaleaceae bacterium]